MTGVFLSCVSQEFHGPTGDGAVAWQGSYRTQLAHYLLECGQQVVYQEAFAQGGSDLLAKIDDYISKECSAVIHLVGHARGWCLEDDLSDPKANSDAVYSLLAKYDDTFLAHRPDLRRLLLARNFQGLSVTQWEAYLAIHHRKPLFIFTFADAAERHPDFEVELAPPLDRVAQAQHVTWLRGTGFDRNENIQDQFHLKEKVVSALIRTGIIARAARNHSLPSNIPCFDGEFIGRNDDRSRLFELLCTRRCGLVTVTGTGGIGKTRLACEVAKAMEADFPGGCFFVELKELETVADVATAIADAIGFKLDQVGEASILLSRTLKERERTLLVLDNFEHIAGLADQTVKLWRGIAPRVQILITSRKPLGLTGEVVHTLRALELPQFCDLDRGLVPRVLNSESIRLFTTIAAERGVDFPADGNTALLLTNICRSLDGQPLAIILVARRTHEFSLEELFEEMENSRIHVAEADGQSLANVIEWSYQRTLDDTLRQAFQRVCVFREGFELEAAKAMLADLSDRPAQLLQRLCECSLVEVVRRGKRTRYQLFQTVQDFGRQKWPVSGREPIDWAICWLTHYLALAQTLSKKVETSAGREALDLLVEERENILGAHKWGLENGQVVASSRLLIAFAPTLMLRGPWQIQVPLYQNALTALPSDAREQRAELLLALSEAMWCEGRYNDAYRQAVEAIRACESIGNSELLADAYLGAGELAEDVGERETAMRHYEVGLEVAIQAGAHKTIARCRSGIAYLLDRFGEYDRALDLIRVAKEGLKSVDDIAGFAKAYNREGLILWHMGNPEDALMSFRHAEELFDKADNPRWRAGAITNTGLALVDADRSGESLMHFTRAATIHRSQGNSSWWAVNEGGHGSALILLNRTDEALAVLEKALTTALETGYEENIAMIYGLIGRAWSQLGNWVQADRDFTHALLIEERIKSRDRRYAGNLIRRCQARLMQGLLQEARIDLVAAQEQVERLSLNQRTNARLVRDDLAILVTLVEKMQWN